MSADPAVWFPAARTGTGTDVFTERLAQGLQQRGIHAGITWLPLRAEYAPWSVTIPAPPAWARVVHVNTWLCPRFLPKHLPVVATIHHSVHDPALRPYKGLARAIYHHRWIAPNERRVLRRADCVVAVSRFVAEIAKRTLVDVPMKVIYNGIDTDTFKPGCSQRAPGEPFRLLYVGSWIRRKGVDLLAPIMRELGDRFELRYTGGSVAQHDKPEMPRNMTDIGRLGGEDAVVAAMQDADALLFPSRSEGLPLVVVEALACGLPIIAARGSSLPEVVDDGITGLLCPRDNVEAFAGAVQSMASDAARRRAMALAARQHVVDAFSTPTMLDAYIAIYQQLVAGMVAHAGSGAHG